MVASVTVLCGCNLVDAGRSETDDSKVSSCVVLQVDRDSVAIPLVAPGGDAHRVLARLRWETACPLDCPPEKRLLRAQARQLPIDALPRTE